MSMTPSTLTSARPSERIGSPDTHPIIPRNTMRLAEIHAALIEGHFHRHAAPFGALAAIEHLARLECVAPNALDFTAPAFARAYPAGGSGARKAWRRAILDLQMLGAPGDVDDDPWSSLRRAARLEFGRQAAQSLYAFAKELPAGTPPCAVSDELLRVVDAALPLKKRSAFRGGMSGFLGLFDSALAPASGLLPSMRPERPAKLRDHRRLAPMAAPISALRAAAHDSITVNAIDYVNRLAVAGGLLDGNSDTLETLVAALPQLPAPESCGVPFIMPKTLRKYMGIVMRATGLPDPRLTPAARDWAALREAARAAGLAKSRIGLISRPATARGLSPRDLTPEIAAEIVATYRQGNSTLLTGAQRGCEQLDVMRGVLADDLLPCEVMNIRRQKRVPPPPPPPPNPVRLAWKALYKALHARGWKGEAFDALSFVKVQAVAAHLNPLMITDSWIEATRKGAPRSNRVRLDKAVRQIRDLRADPGLAALLPPLAEPVDHRRSHGGAPAAASCELEDLMQEMGLAASSRRSMRVAVGALADALKRPEMSLTALLATNLDGFDWEAHARRSSEHIVKIESLRRHRDLPWSTAWRALQRIATEAGLRADDNPIPRIMLHAEGREPHELDPDWAREVDRRLRSTLLHPPHGRADLARTFVRNLLRFDAFHAVPALAESGLLPPVIGNPRSCAPS